MSDRIEAIRILIADDHPALREGLARAISLETGMTVVGSAGDGVEVVAEFRALRPDVVLLDLQMPRKNGLQTLAEIRTMLITGASYWRPTCPKTWSFTVVWRH